MAILQNKLVMLILGGVALAGVIWYSFMRDRGSTSLIETSDLTQATPADGDIVNTLLELRSVSLSGTIFDDPAFVRLKDFGSQIVPEPVGRPNPFAPLQGAASAAVPSVVSSGTAAPATTEPETEE
nr:hypothetical protein [uncultured bacterium]